jgi:hypothetical protein
MSFETISLLLSWMELGALLLILSRLSSTFNLIADTQRELRRAVHDLGKRCGTELGNNDGSGGPDIALGSRPRYASTDTEATIGPAHRFGPPIAVKRTV